VNPLDFPAVPHPRFPVQCHILSAGGDALTPKDIEDFLSAKLSYMQKKLVHDNGMQSSDKDNKKPVGGDTELWTC
jgi:hypothetical protein